MRQIKIVVEKHPEGYVAYPLGLQGIVVGEGSTYEEALADVTTPTGNPVGCYGLAPRLCSPRVTMLMAAL